MVAPVPALARLADTVTAAATAASGGAVQRWRDLGPTLWLAVAVAALVWALLLAGCALATRCREVDAAPATLDLGGPEPAAVVNLLTNSWRLGREAVPATLLDLAARRFVSIEAVGDRTLVRMAAHPPAAELTDYETMVLDHVRRQAVDGVVPAEALTTGPEEESKGWWRRFRRAVQRDARRRGLSRPRWSPAVHTALTAASLAVAALVAVAASTLPPDPKKSDDDPIGAAVALGAVAAMALQTVVETANGERDTPAGRAAASRWLGLRTTLAEDPIFDGYPPAGVAVWDRLLAQGAAMGVAHGAVRALPLGTERDGQAWSSVGGRWRIVSVRYPYLVPPGYGRHPAAAAALGLVQVAAGAIALPASSRAADALLELAATNRPGATAPADFRLGVSIGLGVVLAVAAVLLVRGAAMLGLGVADLVTGRRRVEGRALRVRRRGDKEHRRWYVAVDDGTSSHVRAWRVPSVGARQGATVRAEVTRRLAHVRNLTLVAPAPEAAVSSGAEGVGEEAAAAVAGSLAPMVERLGRRPARRAAAAGEPVPEPAGPPPSLPEAAAVAAAIGRPVQLDTASRPHPLASPGGSATYSAADGTRIQMAWVGSGLLSSQRSLPQILRHPVTGLGDEAYRAVVGGGIIARRAGNVLVAMGDVPGAGNEERDRALAAAARLALDGAGDGDGSADGHGVISSGDGTASTT